MTDAGGVAVAQALVHVAPELLGELTPTERFLLATVADFWLRPDQRIPDGPWRAYGFHAGRGYGKTHGIACHINEGVRTGRYRSVGLGAPTLARVVEVQHKNLIDQAPPWFRPEEHKGNLRWPNGVVSEAHSPEAPGRSRSSNFDVTWLTEIVDWQRASALEFYYNITTATRVGATPRLLWDTTSRGRNEVIEHLLALHRANPEIYPVQWGELFDNPLLTRNYIASECVKYPPGTRKFDEELRGKSFTESAGALFKQAWLDAHRRARGPARWVQRLCSLDPGLSLLADADPTGLVTVGSDADGHGYLERDHSKLMPAEEYAEIIVGECLDNAVSGVVIETNHVGNTARAVVKSRAEMRMARTELIPREDRDKPFPLRKPGTIFVREIHTRDDKGARGTAPASEAHKGFIHLIGKWTELEFELTTYEPGITTKSPNRFDAFNQGFNELLRLEVPSEADNRSTLVEAVNVAAELQKQLDQVARSRRF